MATRTIELTQGFVALVDEEDYDELSRYSWSAAACHGSKIVAVRGCRVGGRHRTVFMHRQILGLEHGDPRQADHLSFDTLDNRRANLRIATPAANKRRVPGRGGSSQFVGVTYDKQRGKWRAQIQIDGKVLNLGRYATEVEAAAARDAWVIANGSGHHLNGAAA